MNKTAMKGDRALVIHSDTCPEAVGLVVEVLSDPFLGFANQPLGEGAHPNGRFRCTPNRTELINEIRYSRGDFWCRTRNLLPLPPDSIAKHLFADEPIERGVSA